MTAESIHCLKDLENLRTAPLLNSQQSKDLLTELKNSMEKASWFTIGIMATSTTEAVDVLRQLEKYFDWPQMNLAGNDKEEGPVFLKANQNSGDFYVRQEYGLGLGILISSHHENPDQPTDTWGPMPLDLFNESAN